MNERYTQIYRLPEKLYTPGAPVIISGGALFRDNENGRLIAQLKIRNIDNRIITSAIARIYQFDSSGQRIDNPIVFQYRDVNTPRNQEFGGKTPFVIPNKTTCSVVAIISEATFNDGSVWKATTARWDQLSDQAVPSEEFDLWRCSCGAVNHENESYCFNCHTDRTAIFGNNGAGSNDFNDAFSEQTDVNNENSKIELCKKCGTVLTIGQNFCPKCGQRTNMSSSMEIISATETPHSGDRRGLRKKKIRISTKLWVPVLVLLVIVAGISAMFLMSDRVESIFISEPDNLKVGETISLVYGVEPSELKGKTEIEWKSSNDAVAVVDSNGMVSAVGEGICTITARADGKSDTVEIIVESASVNFYNIYQDLSLDSLYCEVGTDGSYLSIDTNPLNIDDFSSSVAYGYIRKVHEKLNLPDSLLEAMGHTSALDGRQTETYKNVGVSVSWKYHPDNGLEVIYKTID